MLAVATREGEGKGGGRNKDGYQIFDTGILSGLKYDLVYRFQLTADMIRDQYF